MCRGCVPGEVMHSWGGQVVLIVLWELLELVLVVGETSVHTEVPAGRRAGGRTCVRQDECHRQCLLMCP